jgi:hypothetical protein
MAAKKTPKRPPYAGRFSKVTLEGGWIALGTPVLHAGRLSYSSSTGKYYASIRDAAVLFPKLAKGRYRDGESPVDARGNPTADFLFLFALRESSATHSPGRSYDPFQWATLAIETDIREVEKRRGAPLPAANVAYGHEIASSLTRFQDWVGSRLARAAAKPQSGQIFKKYAKWLDLIDGLEEVGIPEHYQRFLRSVEVAADAAGDVPTKRAVKAEFDRGKSANELGEDTGFRSVMQRLRFEWLPNSGRGPAASPKKGGIRKPT